MKLRGKSILAPMPEIVVIPRDEDRLIFKAKAVLSYDKFDEIFPEPKPPFVTRPGQGTSPNRDDPKYKKKLDAWAEARGHFMFLESLSATEGLEWETVDLKDPETYGNYRAELEKTFAPGEQAAISQAVLKVNGLDEDTMKEAREAFLTGLSGQEEKE